MHPRHTRQCTYVHSYMQAYTNANAYTHTNIKCSYETNSKKRTVVGKSDGFSDKLRLVVNRGVGGQRGENVRNATRVYSWKSLDIDAVAGEWPNRTQEIPGLPRKRIVNQFDVGTSVHQQAYAICVLLVYLFFYFQFSYFDFLIIRTINSILFKISIFFYRKLISFIYKKLITSQVNTYDL